MSDIGRIAYEAFYAGLPKDTWDPWEKVAPDARAIWSRIERAVRAAAENPSDRQIDAACAAQYGKGAWRRRKEAWDVTAEREAMRRAIKAAGSV